jgi:hypothetical protein
LDEEGRWKAWSRVEATKKWVFRSTRPHDAKSLID